MQTVCDIGGTPYKLFYEKQSEAKGMYYHGQVLNPAQLQFSFIEGHEDDKIAYGTFKPHTELLYLFSIHKIKNAASNLQWDRLDDFRLVSNSIVPNGGKIKSKDLKRVSGILDSYKAIYNRSMLPLQILDDFF